ncbi:MAG TPA: hypothetical protein VHQ97_07115 [Solirubrobacterales bacterium]|nr:hypothetical protein [Solirubrobacterales bacterium]
MQKLIAHDPRRRTGLLVAALVPAFALLLMFGSTASAEVKYEFSFGSEGTGAGQFKEPASITQNTTTGDIYIADRQNNRIQKFDEQGHFLEAWGFDVVASGPDDKPVVDEVQRVTIKAVDGTFSLTYGADTTPQLDFDSEAGEVEAALNALPSISTGGGSVSVTGGPGNATGSDPYVVTFGGTLAGSDHPELSIDRTRLARPVGSQLSCKGTARYVIAEGTFTFRWLRNGVPIEGATSSTYTTTGADSGKAIQCEVEATYENDEPFQHGWATHSDYVLVGSTPSPAPPLPPAAIPSPSGPALIGSAGGHLTCNAGTWGNGPTSYRYQWYGHFAELADVTSASNTNELTLSENDLGAGAIFQCKVTATNAGGSAVMWSDLKETEPFGPPRGGVFSFEYPGTEVAQVGGTSTVSTKVNGGAQFEVCKPTDTCKAGAEGPSMGQFSKPRGVAVDNSPGGNGDIYIQDDQNYRVQKLTSAGAPILEIGRDVNQITGDNLCVVASGDDCSAGTKAIDLEPGGFGGWPCPSGAPEFCEFGVKIIGYDEMGNTVAVDPNNGNLYVVDTWENGFVPWDGRMQAFDSSGQFFGQARGPKFAGPIDPIAVAVDREGLIYVVDTAESLAVDIFEESEFTPEGTQRGFADRRQIDEDATAKHVAADPTSDKVWVLDRNISDFEFGGQNHVCGETSNISPRRALIAYDHLGHELDCSVPQGLGAITTGSGLAITTNGFAFVSIRKSNKINVYRLPEETAPTAAGGAVSQITQKSIQMHGEVGPGFEPTEWGFEYGTSPCSSSTCTKVTGGTAYGLKMREVETSISSLEPGTKYYYRTFATNPIGTDVGPEHTFTTFPFIDLVNDPCENALARKQTRAAGLLDCRAYELASAGFTGGYDVISDLAPGQTPFEGFPDAPGKVLYAVKDGGIPGTGAPTNRGPDPYVAVRDAGGERWVTKYVGVPSDVTPTTGPFSSAPSDAAASLDAFAFGGPDICDPCFGDGSSGIPVRMPNGDLVQGMTGSNPDSSAVPAGYIGNPMSSDGTHLVFGTTSQLEPEGNNNGDVTIYDRNLEAGTTQVVSTDDEGDTLTGPGIGELDISANGSRIVVGKRISTDGQGNMYWHPYMHIGSSPDSVDLAPGTTTGVLYAGMSSDGTRVFYSTKDSLVSGDTDTSADIYEVDVAGAGSVTPKLISVGPGGPSNDDGCDPLGLPTTWNSVSGSGKCGAVPLAGGAGVAADGTAYFLSPEQLAGGEGEAGAANLYVIRPGDSSPSFVATIDSATGHAPPPPPNHPVVNGSLITGLSNPTTLAVDQSNGDIYVEELGSNSVSRYTAAGAAKNFTEGPNAGTNELTGQGFSTEGAGQIAVDSSGGLMNGNLYTTNVSGGKVNVYSNTGALLGELTGLSAPCGIAVENSTGALYVSEASAQRISRYLPTSAPSPTVSNANYSAKAIKVEGGVACQLAADNAGHVYSTGFETGRVKKYEASEFEATAQLREGVEFKSQGSVPPAHAVYADPASNELYVDTGSKVVIFDPAGNKLKEFGAGSISGYGGVAVNGGAGAGQGPRAHHAYVVNGTSIAEFGIEPDTYEPIDDPAVVHAVDDNEVHRWSDFQTTPDGRYALLSSIQPSLNPAYDNAGFRMVYRYDAQNGALDCVSCVPTEGPPIGDAGLPRYGLGITNDGRAFFNSTDQLVMRDTNQKLDAYEWEEGELSLISTGFSSAPSSLLTVTRDGTDAFFFTREVLVSDDHNGETMKVYDARAKGGFFKLPQGLPCAASDECHGPSSQAAPPPNIGTHEGKGPRVNKNGKRCKKGQVRKNGKCKKKKRKRKRHQRKHHRTAGHGKGGRR